MERKKHNKERRSGKALAFGVRLKRPLACVASLAKRRMAATGALARDLFKSNSSFKNSVNSP